jgi:uncharacterized protein
MARYRGPIVDVDVHHSWERDEELIPYLPEAWRDYVAQNPSRIYPPPLAGPVRNNSGRIQETLIPGLPIGVNYDVMKRTLLDRHNFFRCVLNFNVGQFASHLNPYFGNALASAGNDWNIENWLGLDDRFYSMVVINSGVPEEAAKEIRRVGKNPRIVGVLLTANVSGRPWGHPIYDPIYKAAVDLGLHISIHHGGFDRPGSSTTAVGGHLPSVTLAMSQFSQAAMHYVASLIVHGTFEKFPELRVLVVEYGVAWLPYVMTRLDNDRKLLEAESPWIKKWPSEYIREHIKLSTEPIEESPDPKDFVQLMQTIDGVEDLLCFSTDWPHWAADDPRYVAKILPEQWHRKIFCTNACEFYGWAPPPEDWTSNPPSAELVAVAEE